MFHGVVQRLEHSAEHLVVKGVLGGEKRLKTRMQCMAVGEHTTRNAYRVTRQLRVSCGSHSREASSGWNVETHVSDSTASPRIICRDCRDHGHDHRPSRPAEVTWILRRTPPSLGRTH